MYHCITKAIHLYLNVKWQTFDLQRFNQTILRHKDPAKKKQYCCLAIGSRDRSVSVWCTHYSRPLIVVHDLFTDSVLDLSWSQIKDQTILLACSTDGTIAALLLSEDELGTSLSAEEKVRLTYIQMMNRNYFRVFFCRIFI